MLVYQNENRNLLHSTIQFVHGTIGSFGGTRGGDPPGAGEQVGSRYHGRVGGHGPELNGVNGFADRCR